MTFTGLTPYYNSLKAAGLIDAHYAFRSGVCYDIINSRVLTTTGCQLQRNGFSIPQGQGPISSGFDLSGVTELTMMFKATITKLASPDSIFVSSYRSTAPASGFQLAKTGTDQIRCVVETGGLTAASGANNSVVVGTPLWYSATAKNNDALKVFVNGVQSGVSINMAGKTLVPNTTTGLYFGTRNGSVVFTGLIAHDYLSIKLSITEAQQQTLIDELDNQIRYETQSMICNHLFPTLGGDVYRASYGLLAGELTMSAGQSLGQLDALKVVSGIHKCSTELYSGQLAKTVVCVTNGTVRLPDPRPTLGTTFSFMKYSGGAWAAATSASTDIALTAGEKLLWATADGNVAVRKY